ncbi:hypothetical protein JYT57_00185 [Nitrosarchaeum koreense]|nr:hypothetical protein [Nitrosarchaeum koreense]
MEEKGKLYNKIHDSKSFQISIHNVNSKSTGSVELSSESTLNLITGSNQEGCSISIPTGFTSFTGSSNDLQSKVANNIISKT